MIYFDEFQVVLENGNDLDTLKNDWPDYAVIVTDSTVLKYPAFASRDCKWWTPKTWYVDGFKPSIAEFLRGKLEYCKRMSDLYNKLRVISW